MGDVTELFDDFMMRMQELRTGNAASRNADGIEEKAFFILGQLASTCDGDEACWEANISACYALGAEKRYGEVRPWGEIPQPRRIPIVEALLNHECTAAIARLEELT